MLLVWSVRTPLRAFYLLLLLRYLTKTKIHWAGSFVRHARRRSTRLVSTIIMADAVVFIGLVCVRHGRGRHGRVRRSHFQSDYWAFTDRSGKCIHPSIKTSGRSLSRPQAFVRLIEKSITPCVVWLFAVSYTGVDKGGPGGPSPPQWPGKQFFLLK